jgi:N-acetylmuramoyl-L-alanine amidase
MAYRVRFIFLIVLGAVTVAAAGLAAAAPGVLVRNIRHSVTGDRARIVIDLSRPAPFTTRLNADSTALLVEIENAAADRSLGEVAVGRHGVRTVVARTFESPDGSRVEIQLALDRPVKWDGFSLPPGEGKPARVVLDVSEAPKAERVAAGDNAPEPAATTPAAEPAPEPASRPEPAAPRPFVVALDPGHGGHDTGTVGRYGLVEKKLCLDIARRVAEDLNRRPGIRAVLTRNEDVYLTLPQRNEIAEKLNADVFVSIHLNSAPSSSARGAEIYFVAPAGAQRAASKELATGEAADEFGLDQRSDGDIVHMLLDVNQQSVLARSELLAASILDEVRERKLLPTRAVKQKSFSVLRTISMPSVLVEAGFLSNSADAKLIRETDGRARISHAIAEGVVTFFRQHPPQRGKEPETARALVHRVQRGDTLWIISRRYNTSVERICELNGLRPSQDLRVGQEILVRRN